MITEGLIEKKTPYAGTNQNAPKGTVEVNGIILTCWSESLFDSIEEGRKYKLEYTEKQSEYNGKKYFNRNLNNIYKDEFEELSIETQQKIKDVGEQMEEIKKEHPEAKPLEVAQKLIEPVVITGESVIELNGRKFLIKMIELK